MSAHDNPSYSDNSVAAREWHLWETAASTNRLTESQRRLQCVVSVSLGSEADDDNSARKQDHDASLMVNEWHDQRAEELIWPKKPAEIHSEKTVYFHF